MTIQAYTSNPPFFYASNKLLTYVSIFYLDKRFVPLPRPSAISGENNFLKMLTKESKQPLRIETVNNNINIVDIVLNTKENKHLSENKGSQLQCEFQCEL